MAYNLLTRVENLVGTVSSVTALNDWLTAGARLFIDILPQKEFLEKASFLTLTNNTSIEGYRLDWATASGASQKLIMVPNSVFEMLSNGSSLYALPSASLGVIAGTIREAQIKVHPGTESVKVLGLSYPTVVNTQFSVTGLPEEWLHALVLYTAIHARKKQLLDILDFDSIVIGSLPSAPLYVGPSLTLTLPPSDFTLATTPPLAPDVPVFIYSGPTPLVLGLVQIVTPSNPPTYTAPVLTLDSPPADFVPTGITIPTPPEVPSIFSTDATAAAIASVSVGALPSAPSYTPPSLNLAPPPADLVFSGDVVVPTSPTTPSISSIDASAATVAAATIAALPTAPIYVQPVMAWSDPPLDFVPGTVPPSGPQAPNISYADASASTVSVTTLEPLGTPPAFTWTPSTGPTTTFSAATPSAPSAPAFTYTPAAQQVLSDIGLDALPTAPTFVPPTPMDFTGMSYPAALDISSIPLPFPPTIPSFTWVDAVVSTIVDSFILDITSALAELTDGTAGYIKGVEDVELAMAKINEIDKRIAAFNVDFNTNLAKARTNAELITDVNKFNELQTLNAQIEEYRLKVQAYGADVSGYNSKISGLVTAYRGQIDAVSMMRNNEMQRFTSEMQGSVSKLDAETRVFTATVQAIISEAQTELEKQKVQAQLNNNTDLQNAIQVAENDIKEYQAGLERFQLQIQNYAAEFNLQHAGFRLDVDIWIAEQKHAFENATQEFNEDIQEYQAQLQKSLAQGRIDIERAIADANLATDVAKQNKIYAFQAAVQDYVQELELFKTNVQAYQTQVQEEIAVFRANLEKWQVVRTTEIQKYAQDVVGAQAAFNAEVESYRAAIGRNQKQAELDLQRYITQAGLDTDVAKDNQGRTLQAAIQDYAQELSLFEKQIAKYQAVVNAEITKARTNFEKWQGDVQAALGKYAQDIQNALGAFQASLAEYRAGVDKLIKQADIDAGIATQQAQLTTDVDKANKAAKLAADLQRWQGELALYSEKLKGYTVQTQNEIAVFQTNLQKWQTVRSTNVQTFQAEIQSAQASFQASLAKYQADLQQAIEQARLDSERIANEAKLASDLGLQNAMQILSASIQQYGALMQLYAKKVDSYQAETNAEVAKYRTNLEKWQTVATTEIQKFQADIQNAQAKLQADIVGYQAEVQKLFKAADATLAQQDIQLRAAMIQVGDYTRELTMFFELKGIPFNLGAKNDAAVNNRTGN